MINYTIKKKTKNKKKTKCLTVPGAGFGEEECSSIRLPTDLMGPSSGAISENRFRPADPKIFLRHQYIYSTFGTNIY